MPTPIEAYRQGYEQGHSDSIGGRLAQATMGMLRDDPGGHFQNGYSDGAAGKPFSPPATPQKSLAKGLIPKFSENPIGWLLGVLIMVEVWALWQLIKAPFELIGPLTRGGKPSAIVIVKSIVVAGLAVVLVWVIPRANDNRSPASSLQTQPTRSAPTLRRWTINNPFIRPQSPPLGTPASSLIPDARANVSWVRNSPLLAEFGPMDSRFGFVPTRFFQQRPDILEQIRAINAGFEPRAFSDTFDVLVARLPDTREFVLAAGCQLHMCGARHSAFAIDTISGEPFLLEVSVLPEPETRTFFGRDDSAVRTLLAYIEKNGSQIFDMVNATADPGGSVPQGKAPEADGSAHTASDTAETRTIDPLIQSVVERWASAIKSSDLSAQVALYDDPILVYYGRQNISKADLEREIASAYKTYSAFPKLNVSALSSRTMSAGVVRVEFNKEFGAVRRKGGYYEGSVHSELTFRQTNDGWRIAGEKDTKVHWTKKTP